MGNKKIPSLITILLSCSLVLFSCSKATSRAKIRAQGQLCSTHDRPRLTNNQSNALELLLAKLVGPPFGTGAVLSISTGGQVNTITKGELRDGANPVNASTLFNVASVSKTITAARVVALSHQGRIGLDDPVHKYLPGVHLLDATDEDLSTTITIRQLLRHQTGLPHQPGAQLNPLVFDNQWQNPELLKKITRNWSIRLAHIPGGFHYSNMGYALLGAIIEKVESCRFADCMNSYLSGLGLHRATFAPIDAGANATHGLVARGDTLIFNPPAWYASSYSMPFTGAWISMPDLAKFGHLLGAAVQTPTLALHAMARPLKDNNRYGLGIIHQQRLGELTLEHDGSGPGFMARLVVVPERNLVLAVACNGSTESREEIERFRELTDAMLTVVLNKEPSS